ncbi:MAG: hypothetical protein AB2813_11700 [Candidatus Sedimenticola endophacoides]
MPDLEREGTIPILVNNASTTPPPNRYAHPASVSGFPVKTLGYPLSIGICINILVEKKPTMAAGF